MSVDSYLANLASEMVIRDSKKESISLSISTLHSRLKEYFGKDIIDVIKFGSYTRGTILPRRYDDKSDVDIMIVFNNDYDYKPQTFLDRLKKFAQQKYSTSYVYQSNPTIVLELNHIKLELVPAVKIYSWSDDYYDIPYNSSSWLVTRPKAFDNLLVECNKNNLNKIKPIVRLIKHWNIVNNYRDADSYQLEKKIAEEMKYSYFSCSSYSDYLKQALQVIRLYSSEYRIDLAISRIDKALNLEAEGYPYSAESEIKKVFPGI